MIHLIIIITSVGQVLFFNVESSRISIISSIQKMSSTRQFLSIKKMPSIRKIPNTRKRSNTRKLPSTRKYNPTKKRAEYWESLEFIFFFSRAEYSNSTQQFCPKPSTRPTLIITGSPWLMSCIWAWETFGSESWSWCGTAAAAFWSGLIAAGCWVWDCWTVCCCCWDSAFSPASNSAAVSTWSFASFDSTISCGCLCFISVGYLARDLSANGTRGELNDELLVRIQGNSFRNV